MPKIKRVLIIDDNDKFCEALKRCLTREGFAVVTTPTAEKALALLNSEQGMDMDIFILDVDLPGKMGFSALVELKELVPAPVIMITGHPFEDIQTHAKELGAEMLLEKPIDFATIGKTIREVLAKKG